MYSFSIKQEKNSVTSQGSRREINDHSLYQVYFHRRSGRKKQQK
jgi:hypothetical protein